MSSEEGSPVLGALLERNLPALRAFIRLRTNRRIRARESCSDMVQSVCRELLEGRDRFRYEGEAALKGWLFTAALRKIVERDRRMHAQLRDVDREIAADALVGDEQTLGELMEEYATVSTPTKILAAKEQVEAIESAFDELTEDQREVLTLVRLAGLSHAEVANQTGRSEENSRQILRRALVRLAVVLDERERGS